MKRFLSLIILLFSVCSFAFADTCVTTFSGTISSDGTGTPGAPVTADLTTGCGCGTINSMEITNVDLTLNCNLWFLYDVTYDGTGGTTLIGVCDADLQNLVLPVDATTITIVQYDCCGDGLADNTPITFDVTYDFTDDGTCPPPPTASASCLTPIPICTDQALTFPASVNQPNANVTNPNVGYGCLSSQPNPEWFYLEIATSGTLNFDISNSALNDIDWAVWGPFTALSQLTTNCSSGASPFDIPVDCDYTTDASGTIALGTVTAGSVYAILVNNFDNTATDITISTSAGSTGSTDCTIVGPGGSSCAATCADAATNGCNLFVTPVNTPPTSYAEIQAGGGESCFFPPVDVSTAPSTEVQCFNYTHNTPGSTEFNILIGTSVIETNDQNGVNDCNIVIDQVELFDASNCSSIGIGTGWANVPQGAAFTVCVTVTADNGTAEGDCNLNCLAHAIVPVTSSNTECAATCADASTNACNVYITPADTPPTSYGDIQTGGGESCFLNPIDVSTTPGTVTQCYNYTHSTPGSSEFGVFVGNSVLETNDTDGINECGFTIDNVEFYDGITCAFIASGGGLTNVPQGASFTVCITATADNGTAEGDCVFQCLANAITPITSSTGDCAATCADATTNTCNHYETAVDIPVTSYTEIQTGGGESCFSTPIDVSTAAVSVTQCFTYTHTAAGSDAFGVLSGVSVLEFNDTNGTNDCGFNIDSIEIFDQATCTSFGAGPQGATISGVSVGDQFTICVTGTADNGTAEGNCSFDCMAHSVTPLSATIVEECAATCAAVDTSACNVFVTPADTPPTTYGDIQTGGGESCFANPIDVSTAPATVTQCFEYTHNTPGSSEFAILSGVSMTENNDTNGNNDCNFNIDQIEIFDEACNSFGVGSGLTSAIQGVTYTICVTSTADNGTAEGNCSFDCMASSVTPITAICDEVFSYTIDDVCSDEGIDFVQNAGCDAGPGNIDLDYYIYAPGNAPQEAPAGYDPFQGGTFDVNYPIANADLITFGGVGPGYGGVICDDALDILSLTNTGCGPATVSFFVLTWDRAYDTNVDSLFGEYNTASCATQRYDVVIYPAPLTTQVTNDGSTCGLPQVELHSADTTICEIITGSQCSSNGDALNYDFSSTATAVALANAPAACALPTLTGTITCSGCTVNCGADGGITSTTDPTTICIDGVADPIDVSVTGNTGTGGCGYIITDNAASPTILSPGIVQQGVNPATFNLDGAGAGTCQIWSICWDGSIPTVVQGDLVADIAAPDVNSCFDLSGNAVVVIRENAADAGTVSTTDPTTICVDGVADPIDVAVQSNSGTGDCGFIITDNSGTPVILSPGIVQVGANPGTFDLDGAGVGTCQIWSICWNGTAPTVTQGTTVSDISQANAASCYDLSAAPVTVIREICGGPQDCATLIANGTDICTVIVDGAGNLDPNHPLASQDCDNGGIDNYTECLSGEDPSDPMDDCTAAEDESVDICALIGSTGSGDLVISGIGDGPLTGGTPKFIELYVVNNIADLGIYGIESTNNGVGTSGVEFTLPTGTATAGTYLYISSSTAEFTAWFGFAPNYVTTAINVNGDDAVVLYESGSIVDVFGDVNADGSGTAWDYADGYAYRNNNTGPSSAFILGDWTYSGIDVWDGETDNSSASDPFPTGTFTTTGGGSMLGSVDCDGDGVTNANECVDNTDPFDPCDYEDTSITGPVTADQTNCACPDLSPILNLLPNNIAGLSNINVVAEVFELGGVDTDGSVIRIRMPSDPRLQFTYDPTLTNIGFNQVNNADWNYVGDNGIVHEFTYIPSVLAGNARSAYGFIGTYDPQSTDGQTTLTVTIVPLSGGECVFTNNTDAETLVYFD